MNGSTLTLTLAAALAAAGLTRRGGANRATLTPGLRQVSGETFYWSTDRLVSPGFEVPQAVPRDTPVEDVFERVRQRTAPQAPSRLRCVYVCPKLGRGFCSGRRHEHVYKVKVWGKVFTTDGGFWTEAVFRPSHAEGFAESYWSPRGDVMINHAEETLVEGRVVVVSKASTGHQGSRAARKPKPTTLSDLNLPTTWFHGTAVAFTGPLRPNKGMGGACVWLADREGAQAYAKGQRGRLIEVRLALDTKVVDLSNASDPIVREFIRLDRSASNMLWHGREEVTDEEMADAVASWERRSTHYDAIEARGWAKSYFRKVGADALLVRDVKGWGGHQAMPSLCVLNRGKIAQQKGATP